MSAAPSHFVVERLQGLLPYEAELISAIAEKLVDAWRGKLGDVRTDAASAAPQLTDLALTLHRLGGASRQSGIALIETMIEIEIGRAHVWTPVTNAHHVCRPLLAKTTHNNQNNHNTLKTI